jgi:hypothetical protein
VLISALLLGSCGGGGEGGEDGQARTVETTTTTEGEEPTPTSTTVPPRDIALNEVIVQLGDLPTGWSPSAPEDDGEDDSFCEGHDPLNQIEPTEEAESSFQQSDFGPFVFAGAGTYTGDQASEVMDAFAETADACQSFTETDEDGAETTYTISPLSFPDLSDDTFAFRMSATSPLGPFNLDVAAVRKGTVVLIIVNGGLGAADSALTEKLMRTMVDRL